MKKKYIFSNDSVIDVKYEADKDNNVKRIEFDMCIFSTGYNRNNAFFQVSKLLEYRNKLNRLLTCLNHNLKLTGGKYMSNKTQYSDMQAKFNESNLEIWLHVVSEDPELIKYKDEITAPSIELLVEEKNLISSENGEYFIDFDFVAIAFLTGIPAGNGDARIESLRQFDLQYNNNNIMQENEVKALLEAQKTELKAEFELKAEQLKVEFNQKISEEKSGNSGEYTYINEKGETCKTTWASAYQSLTEIIETGELKEDSPLILMMKSKKFKLIKDGEEETTPVTPPVDTEIEAAAAAVTQAENFAAKMATVRTDEELESNSTSAETKINFKETYNQIIKNKFN